MPDIDPSDVLPQNNLPSPSAQWGRALEKRLLNVEKRLLIDNQDIAGQNRNTAAMLQGVSDQLAAISDAQATLAGQQARMASSQRALREEFTVGFGFSEVRTTEITAPAWANFARVELSLPSEIDSGDLVVRSEVTVRTAHEEGISSSWVRLAEAEFLPTRPWQPGDPGFNPVVFSLDSLPDKVVRIENFTREWGGSSGVWDITAFYFIMFIE